MAKKNAVELCVEDILRDFAGLPDPRSHVNQRHLLGDVIVISIMTVVVGAEGPEAIGVWTAAMKTGSARDLLCPQGFMPALGNHGREVRARGEKPSAEPVYGVDTTAFRRFFELPGDEWK